MNVSFLFAIIFTVHPISTYAVACIPGRNDSMLTCFVLASFIFFLNYLKTQTAANVPDNGDLLKDSAPYLKTQTAANVPDTGDLLKDSEPYLKNQTSLNAPASANNNTSASNLISSSSAFKRRQVGQNRCNTKRP